MNRNVSMYSLVAIRNSPVRCHVCDHDGPRDPHPKARHGGDDLSPEKYYSNTCVMSAALMLVKIVSVSMFYFKERLPNNVYISFACIFFFKYCICSPVLHRLSKWWWSSWGRAAFYKYRHTAPGITPETHRTWSWARHTGKIQTRLVLSRDGRI